jgi:hypothetical protein
VGGYHFSWFNISDFVYVISCFHSKMLLQHLFNTQYYPSNMLSCAFFQDFLKELLEKDAKTESLMKMGFPEDEANMSISRCGVLSTELVACHFGQVYLSASSLRLVIL